jgi:hypothetical protein
MASVAPADARASGSLPPVCPRTVSRPARMSRWTVPLASSETVKLRDGVIGKMAARSFGSFESFELFEPFAARAR